jgi:tRNA-binding EMAP/Myf-like protein
MSIVSYKNVNSVMKTLYVLQLTNCKAQMQGKKVIVLSNLKPRNMRGVKSSGMLMAASDSKHENVELLFPPEEATPGERIWFGSEEEKDNQPDAATPNQAITLPE